MWENDLRAPGTAHQQGPWALVTLRSHCSLHHGPPRVAVSHTVPSVAASVTRKLKIPAKMAV